MKIIFYSSRRYVYCRSGKADAQITYGKYEISRTRVIFARRLRPNSRCNCMQFLEFYSAPEIKLRTFSLMCLTVEHKKKTDTA